VPPTQSKPIRTSMLRLFESRPARACRFRRPMDGWNAPPARSNAGAGKAWPSAQIRQALLLPHAATALRTLHQWGGLEHLPELREIEALVVRDFYHATRWMSIRWLPSRRAQSARHAGRSVRRAGGGNETWICSPSPSLFHDVGKGTPDEKARRRVGAHRGTGFAPRRDHDRAWGIGSF